MTPIQSHAALLLGLHERLAAQYDLDAWHWRADTTPLAICVGAILVQHTSWTNVERALANLNAAAVFSAEAMAALPEEALAMLVRPVGTPLTKARRLQTFLGLASEAGGLDALLARPADDLRRQLLATPGIGPETADVILLYAARLPAIVHDAYTARLLRRVGVGPERDRYADWRTWLDECLPSDLAFRQRHHAAIVLHCQATCRPRPRCGACPLLDVCAFGQERAGWTPLGGVKARRGVSAGG